MKKLVVVFALGVFASCGNGGHEEYTTQDSLAAVDSMHNANSMAVDSAANMQRSSIDSMQQGAAMDSIKR